MQLVGTFTVGNEIGAPTGGGNARGGAGGFGGGRGGR